MLPSPVLPSPVLTTHHHPPPPITPTPPLSNSPPPHHRTTATTATTLDQFTYTSTLGPGYEWGAPVLACAERPKDVSAVITSPSGNRSVRVVKVDPAKGEAYTCLEVWEGSGLVARVPASELHEGVMASSATIGGFSWNRDETKVRPPSAQRHDLRRLPARDAAAASTTASADVDANAAAAAAASSPTPLRRQCIGGVRGREKAHAGRVLLQAWRRQGKEGGRSRRRRRHPARGPNRRRVRLQG